MGLSSGRLAGAICNRAGRRSAVGAHAGSDERAGLASMVFSLARWDRAGPHFHAMFQFLLMGLNGAFLTGDLFNLFVFFELLLAASYGLALHGSGTAASRLGLHYIAVNLAASLLFLIGVSLIYGVTGTLNMADLAAAHPASRAPKADGLLEAGAACSASHFWSRQACGRLCFWLPTTYAAAAPPVACHVLDHDQGRRVRRVAALAVAVRRRHRRVGAFRRRMAVHSPGWQQWYSAPSASLASQDIARLAGFSVLISSGTVMAAIAMGQVGVTGAALYYLVSSTLAIGAFSC